MKDREDTTGRDSHDRVDDLLRAGLQQTTGGLPSNFSYRVMASIRERTLALRLARARQEALWQSMLVTLLGAVVGTGLLVATRAYLELGQQVALPLLDGGILPALAVLAVFFILDRFLHPAGLKSREAHDRGPGS